MKAHPSFSPRLAAQIVGVSLLPLANRERENFYFAFAGGVRPPLPLRFFRPARNPSLRPPNLSMRMGSLVAATTCKFDSYESIVKLTLTEMQ
jgi:hypothetical protein